MSGLVSILRKPALRLADLDREPLVSATVEADVPRVLGYADYKAMFAPLAREEAEKAYPEHMAANRMAYANQAAAAHAQNALIRPHYAAANAIGFVARRVAELTSEQFPFAQAAE